MMKNYLLNLLQQCSEKKFGQDAIEWGIASGLVPLTYDLDLDVRETMSRYDEIIEAYRHSLAQVMQEPPKPRAPMERAIPSRRERSGRSTTSIRKKRAA